MTIVSLWLKKQMAGSLVMMMALPFAAATPAPQQQSSGSEQSQSVTGAPKKPETAESNDAKPESAANLAEPVDLGNPTPTPSQTQSENVPSAPAQQQSNAPKPVGTAAAPYEKTTGVAASRPAGAVIAPGKQKRAHVILIRVAIVVGAAIAVGTVVALSKGSPSRPN